MVRVRFAMFVLPIFLGVCMSALAVPQPALPANSISFAGIARPVHLDRAVSTPDNKEAEHGISQSAVEVFRIFGFPITNSMVVTWVVALGLIIFARVATRNMS